MSKHSLQICVPFIPYPSQVTMARAFLSEGSKQTCFRRGLFLELHSYEPGVKKGFKLLSGYGLKFRPFGEVSQVLAGKQ